eukprot:XP_002258164.1 KIR-like protein [Plasmodium knowlesi strain H]
MAAGVTPDKAQTFPSWIEYYDKFENGHASTGTCTNGCQDNMNQVPTTHYTGGLTEIKVQNAICTACKIYKDPSKLSNKEAYHFLYYWIGDKLSKSSSVNDGTFGQHVQRAWQTINGYCAPKGSSTPVCGLPYGDSPNKGTFNSQKIIFDFSYDYSTIEKEFQNVDSYCNGHQWSPYREKIESACREVEKYCTNENSNNSVYCADFSDKYKVYCEAAKLPKLKCDLKFAQKTAAQATEATQKAELAEREKEATQAQLSDALNQSSTASSLSSAFGTLALMELPAVAYLFYKYKPWSSWFGNHSNGGKGTRRKRRRSVGHHFDASTEDNLTEYTMDNSTIDPMDGDSSTLRSDVYNTRQSSGRRNSTRGPGIVGYQNM